MRSVHIVIGETGEFEDRHQWLVAAFSTKARAETFCGRANDWLKKHGLHVHSDYDDRNQGLHKWLNKNPYDAVFQLDYTGARYFSGQVFLDPPLPTKAQGA